MQEPIPARSIRAQAWFDGERLHRSPVRLHLADGRIAAIEQDHAGPADLAAGFLCPGLVEAHAHLILDGTERRPDARRGWLEQDDAALLAAGRRHLADCAAVGITLVNDAGDTRGINHALRAAAVPGLPRVRSAGAGIRRRGRYGSFIAGEVDDLPTALAAVDAAAAGGAEAIKIVLTGIIDFAAAQVKGAPQFDRSLLRALVERAHAHALPTFAHCSGSAGLDLALAAGIDSIEHGFFITHTQLLTLAAQGTAWTPTLAPVAFQRDQPQWAGWDAAAVAGLTRICADHAAALRRGRELGVAILAGSDAGSHGVPHGQGLIDEIAHLGQALGGIEAALHAATLAPRRAWGLLGGRIAVGEPAELAGYDDVPGPDAAALRRARWVLVRPSALAPA